MEVIVQDHVQQALWLGHNPDDTCGDAAHGDATEPCDQVAKYCHEGDILYEINRCKSAHQQANPSCYLPVDDHPPDQRQQSEDIASCWVIRKFAKALLEEDHRQRDSQQQVAPTQVGEPLPVGSSS